jgi:hypothetical protein
MSKLEDYIRSNAGAFDAEPLPEGAEERFLGRWEAGRSRVRILRTVLPAAAAAALAVLLLLPPAGSSRDWLRAAGDTPEGVYAGYMAQVTKAWAEAGTDEDKSEMLRNLTEETVPLADQLPDELSDAEKAVILKEHYNTILDGVHQILSMTE